MGDNGGNYYDNKTFNTRLKGISTVKRVSDNADISYNHSSIIYKYDPNWTPLSSEDSEYNTASNLTYRILKNQLLSISGELITTGYGKDVDVSLNIYLDGNNTNVSTNVDISGIPFIGNYSNTVHGGDVSMNVLDLFEYKIIEYTITTTDQDPDVSYNIEYNINLNAFTTIFPVAYKKFSYDDISGVWFISTPLSNPPVLCSDPVPRIYGYARQKKYTYPSSNVNNTHTERYVNSEIYVINNFINLPELPTT